MRALLFPAASVAAAPLDWLAQPDAARPDQDAARTELEMDGFVYLHVRRPTAEPYSPGLGVEFSQPPITTSRAMHRWLMAETSNALAKAGYELPPMEQVLAKCRTVS
eukprot:SAG31_NODE_1123_length_9787_cov_5.258877_5_plen_107_part_00